MTKTLNLQVVYEHMNGPNRMVPAVLPLTTIVKDSMLCKYCSPSVIHVHVSIQLSFDGIELLRALLSRYPEQELFNVQPLLPHDIDRLP